MKINDIINTVEKTCSVHRIKKKTLQLFYIPVVIVFHVVFISGCAGDFLKPLQDSDKKAFENENNTVVVRYKSLDPMITWGLTGSAVVDWPEDLQREFLDKEKLPPADVLLQRHSIPDPLEQVAHYFVEGLKKRTGLNNFTFIEQPVALPVKEGYSHYKSQFKQAYVIEIQPEPSIVAWGFATQVLSPKTYKLTFFTNAHIIRQSDSKEIWRGRCAASGQVDKKLNVHINELLSKNNPHVQKVVDMGMKKCAAILIDQYFGSTVLY